MRTRLLKDKAPVLRRGTTPTALSPDGTAHQSFCLGSDDTPALSTCGELAAYLEKCINGNPYCLATQISTNSNSSSNCAVHPPMRPCRDGKTCLVLPKLFASPAIFHGIWSESLELLARMPSRYSRASLPWTRPHVSLPLTRWITISFIEDLYLPGHRTCRNMKPATKLTAASMEPIGRNFLLHQREVLLAGEAEAEVHVREKQCRLHGWVLNHALAPRSDQIPLQSIPRDLNEIIDETPMPPSTIIAETTDKTIVEIIGGTTGEMIVAMTGEMIIEMTGETLAMTIGEIATHLITETEDVVFAGRLQIAERTTTVDASIRMSLRVDHPIRGVRAPLYDEHRRHARHPIRGLCAHLYDARRHARPPTTLDELHRTPPGESPRFMHHAEILPSLHGRHQAPWKAPQSPDRWYYLYIHAHNLKSSS